MILPILSPFTPILMILTQTPAAASLQNALSGDFGWAVGLALGAWVTGGISQGHINPAVTIAMATFRPKDFPWRKVPGYILGQVLGGLCGAGIVYANYIHAIDLVEGGRHIRTVPGTASLFGTYAVRSNSFSILSGYLSGVIGYFARCRT